MDKEEIKYLNILIFKISRLDEQALSLLYQKIGGRLLNIARGIIKDNHLAEDAVQETMIKIVKYANTFKDNNGYAWIIKILKNQCFTILKDNQQEYAVEDFFSLEDTYNSGINIEKRIEVKSAIEKLDSEEQNLIVMKYILDMTVREIASKLNQSKSNIALKIKSAEDKLRNLLS